MSLPRTPEPPFIDVPGALDEIRAGRMVVVVDDEDRENEGDLTLAAEFVTPEAINFMARYGRGLICLTLTEERADYLRLFPMTRQNSSRFGTAFTETIEAREGVTTGISAADRAHTVRVAIDEESTAADLARPGHIFPLRARRGGVLVRAGQTEASVDLARMAGLNPSGVICEIMRDDGEMARVPDLIPFCREHGLRILTVAELIRYRLRHERYIVRAGETRVNTRYGEFRMIAYESEVNGGESHIALVRGDLCPGGCPAFIAGPAGMPGEANYRPPCCHAVLVRVHTRCTAGDVFGADCHCRETLDQSMRMIAEEGCGAIIYLHNTSRGFDIEHSPAKAFEAGGVVPPSKVDPVQPGQIILHQELRSREGAQDRSGRILRAIGLGGQILSDLGIQRIRLLSNTPMHIPALEGFGLEIVEQVPIPLETPGKAAKAEAAVADPWSVIEE
ncbi:3,4-dihydroxy-2-butanone-4-phosphate synthase [Occallatibacter riparius]|uniref:3,4-dihydroxy-2-butanone 4-phosphate synthase n=1 Tax=Occallatibacter riparius TaxID=1002689 RepID=A0A9J7BJ93_9BACT|nr:3,4-dihydroxy-2-butanone-4-phosphate synthase [Occallatibacter riparius]UWZ82595.1 3,4-dihydroxy-2-butanone-4-phosphate synthase [Occallatibacter riparius]